MKAMIFAAGKGTRLGRPAQSAGSKNKPLIAHVLDKLRYYGFREIARYRRRVICGRHGNFSMIKPS